MTEVQMPLRSVAKQEELVIGRSETMGVGKPCPATVRPIDVDDAMTLPLP